LSTGKIVELTGLDMPSGRFTGYENCALCQFRSIQNQHLRKR